MDQVSAQQGGATLGEYSGAFRRRWWVVALGAVLGLALAAVYLLLAPKTYIATASVQVEPLGGSADNAVVDARTNSGVNLDTEAQLVKSQAVSSEAKVLLQSPEIVGQLVQHVTVEVPPNTNVLRISFAADTPEEARDGASAYARGYLKNRFDDATDALADQERALKQQIEELEAQIETATPDERDGIQTSLDAVRFRLGQVIGNPVDPGKVISEALIPRRPASPNAGLVLASGLAFGLLIGLAGLYWLERRDGRCYDWRTVERRLGLPVLANVPGTEGSAAPLFEPHSAGAEAFGELRNALMTGLGDEPATLVIATPTPGHGADVAVANLAVTFARAGHSTTIVVADESSDLPNLFGLPATEGLSEVLRGSFELDHAVQSVPDLPSLQVLPAGHGLHGDDLDLEGSGTNDVLEALRERSNYVLIRPRPSESSSDAQFFGRHANAAIIVIEIGHTLREAVSAGVRQLKLVGTQVPGAVTLPAFGAPEPAPPRAVTTSVSDVSAAPRPALRLKDNGSTAQSEARGGPPNGASRDEASGRDGRRDSGRDSDRDAGRDAGRSDGRDEPLRKAPPRY
ncbi:MAG TPA: Wzz/FepE/Etk N-terminal domain-containing protein [Actinomycetes bacterium]|nr:Wzz/FepE/Etk N-terminal domain-containing protein [Actinomycetes bacterium]